MDNDNDRITSWSFSIGWQTSTFWSLAKTALGVQFVTEPIKQMLLMTMSATYQTNSAAISLIVTVCMCWRPQITRCKHSLALSFWGLCSKNFSLGECVCPPLPPCSPILVCWCCCRSSHLLYKPNNLIFGSVLNVQASWGSFPHLCSHVSNLNSKETEQSTSDHGSSSYDLKHLGSFSNELETLS